MNVENEEHKVRSTWYSLPSVIMVVIGICAISIGIIVFLEMFLGIWEATSKTNIPAKGGILSSLTHAVALAVKDNSGLSAIVVALLGMIVTYIGIASRAYLHSYSTYSGRLTSLQTQVQESKSALDRHFQEDKRAMESLEDRLNQALLKQASSLGYENLAQDPPYAGEVIMGFDALFSLAEKHVKRATNIIRVLVLGEKGEFPESWTRNVAERLETSKQERNPVWYSAVICGNLDLMPEETMERIDRRQEIYEEAGAAELTRIYVRDLKSPLGMQVIIIDYTYLAILFTSSGEHAEIAITVEVPDIVLKMITWFDKVIEDGAVRYEVWAKNKRESLAGFSTKLATG